MTMTGVRSLAGKALMVGALGLAALGSAQATLVVGVWDPVYDATKFANPIPGIPTSILGWRGFVTLSVPSACLTQIGPPQIYSTAAGPCLGTSITEAKVELYDTLQPGQPTLETLDFTLDFALGVSDIALQSPGVVIGIETAQSNFNASSIALAKYLGSFQADFALDFDVTLLGPDVKMAYEAGAGAFTGFNAVPATIKFFVPEPMGLALTGAALLALGWTRRRRQR